MTYYLFAFETAYCDWSLITAHFSPFAACRSWRCRSGLRCVLRLRFVRYCVVPTGLRKTFALLFLPYYRPAGAGGRRAKGREQGAKSKAAGYWLLVTGYWSVIDN